MKILILKEHHGTVYLNVSTPEQMDKVCLSILRARSSTDEYLSDVEENQKPQEPAISFDESQSLPAGRVRDVALAEWSGYHRDCEEYERRKHDFDRTTRALETNNGRLAYKILADHRHYEDEGFEIRDVLDEY